MQMNNRVLRQPIHYNTPRTEDNSPTLHETTPDKPADARLPNQTTHHRRLRSNATTRPNNALTAIHETRTQQIHSTQAEKRKDEQQTRRRQSQTTTSKTRNFGEPKQRMRLARSAASIQKKNEVKPRCRTKFPSRKSQVIPPIQLESKEKVES